jgi:AraC family transcriptional regulator, activator of mtrCDE
VDRADWLSRLLELIPVSGRVDMLRDYFPRRLVVRAAEHSPATAQPGTGAQVVRLVSLMRSESAAENLGGLAMLNALSTALFTLTLRLASEAKETPTGPLALAGNSRLSPALPTYPQPPQQQQALTA